MIPTLQLMVGYLILVRAVQRDQPAPLAQFDCNENCATILGGGRGHGRCLHLTLRGFECGNPNLSERPRSPPHGIYEATKLISLQRAALRSRAFTSSPTAAQNRTR